MILYEYIDKNKKVFLIPVKEIKLLTYTPSNETVNDEILEIHFGDNKTLTIKGNVEENYYTLRKIMGKLK